MLEPACWVQKQPITVLCRFVCFNKHLLGTKQGSSLKYCQVGTITIIGKCVNICTPTAAAIRASVEMNFFDNIKLKGGISNTCLPPVTQAISPYSTSNLRLSASSCFLSLLAQIYPVLGIHEPCSSHEKPADDNGITETVLSEKKKKKKNLSSSLKLQHTAEKL